MSEIPLGIVFAEESLRPGSNLDGKTQVNENPKMDAEPKEETGNSTDQGSTETVQETPQSKLRDLRPEKDPMGAGRNRASKIGAKNS